MPTPLILIANRGEIACRVIKTARSLGYRTAAIYSDADEQALHVEMADLAVHIGAAPASASYLNIDAILDAAKRIQATAVHPGYGFLSENAQFAERCRAAGLLFIGPPDEAIRVMGSKRLAKERVRDVGVPCVEGYIGAIQDIDVLIHEAKRIGFPLMIKASAGGGGRGLRFLPEGTDDEQLLRQLSLAQSEAMQSFGDQEVILERAILQPHHVEIQIFGDMFGNIVHLGERDCSVQRRHQKVFEESPSPLMTPALREKMGAAAVAAAKTVGYVGAGTVEFLVDANRQFYFMEMNTRLQVEHPVTEMVTGFDLVAWQIDVAFGKPLPVTQQDIKQHGHAIEARIYAEDTESGGEVFLPSTGTITAWIAPSQQGSDEVLNQHTGIRVDSGVRAGSRVTPYYDAMIAKVIAHGKNREEARRRLLRAVSDLYVAGVVTNQSYLQKILEHPVFAQGQATTQLIAQMQQEMQQETHAQPAQPARIEDSVRDVLAVWCLSGGLSQFASVSTSASTYAPRDILGQIPKRVYLKNLATQEVSSHIQKSLADENIHIQIQRRQNAQNAQDSDVYAIKVRKNGITTSWLAALSVDHTQAEHAILWLHDGWRTDRFTIDTEAVSASLHQDGKTSRNQKNQQATAPMAGTVVAVFAKEGDALKKGTPLCVVEAMKMQMEVLAPFDITVDKVLVKAGAQVQKRDVLVTFS